MTKKILKWTDRKLEEINKSDEIGGKELAKAFGVGAIEGFIDGLVINGAVLFGIGVVNIVKGIIKKK